MIEKFHLQCSIDAILKRYSISLNEGTLPINAQIIEPRFQAYVITSENDHELRRMKFGFTPHWAKEEMNIINARAEGNRNKGNDPFYFGPNSIFLKPSFVRAIQYYRCLVIADGYIDNSTKQHRVFSFRERPVAMLGIYAYWKNSEGIITPGFAIITKAAPPDFQKLGISRIPVIPSFLNCTKWIKPGKPMNYYLPVLNFDWPQDYQMEVFNGVIPTISAPVESVPKLRDPLPKRYYGSKRDRREPSGFSWGENRLKLNQL